MRQSPAARAAVVVAVLGGIVTLAAGSLLVEHVTVGALIAVVAGLLCLTGGIVLARRILARIRYRISKPFSALLLVTKIAAGLAVFVALFMVATALDFPSLPRRVMVAILVGGLGWVIADHVNRTTLFLADATGVRFGRTPVPWPAIAQLVVSPGAQPGTAEIGATPTPGAPPAPVAVVPAATVRWDRLAWAAAQASRPDIQLVGQLPPPAPPGSQRPPLGWAIGGIGGSVLLLAGVVVAVSLGDNDSPAATSGGGARSTLKYSASTGEGACRLIDVSVLKKWSTIQDVASESSRRDQPEVTGLNCHAYNNAAFAEGNTAAMDLTIVVSSTDVAAKALYNKEHSGYICGSGDPLFDVTDSGEVPDLGSQARYAAAMQNSSGNIDNHYTLRMLDGNLTFCLHLSTSAHEGAPFIIGKAELGEFAAKQARLVIGKLRAPEQPTATRGAGTGSYRDRLTAQSREYLEYLDAMRKLDPCGFINQDAVNKIGSPVHFGNGRSLNTCEVRFAPPAGPKEISRIELSTGSGQLSGNGGSRDVKVGDRTARVGLEGDLCGARIDFDERQGIDFLMSGARSTNVCPELLEIMSASVPLFKERPSRADSRHTVSTRLARIDPCAVLDVIGKGRDTIEVNETPDPGECRYVLGKPGGRDEPPWQGIEFQFNPLTMVTDGFSGHPIKVSGVPATESGNDRGCTILLGVGADHPFDVVDQSGEKERWADMIKVDGNTGCDELRKTAVELVRLYKAAK